MGRGNQDKRRFQAAHSGKGFLDASDIVRSQKRERPTRDQRPPTLPKVDVHGILFGESYRADRDRPARLEPHGGVPVRVRGRRRHVRIFGRDLVLATAGVRT